MDGAKFLVNFLEKKGVEYIFGYPGGVVIYLYDVLDRSNIKHILTRHEQGAVHAADGYARATGKVGICFATSGPGATNLVTGLANAYLDSVPLLAITGQVECSSIGSDAFQEADIIGITMPITKHNHLVKKIEDLPAVMEEAWQVAQTGRPGPVLIDIPKDLFKENFDFTSLPKQIVTRKTPRKNSLEEQLGNIIHLVKEAKQPLLLAGGGIISAQASPELDEFVKYTNMPVVTTLMGKGSISEKQEGVLGMIGMHGKPAANLALSSCDLLLAIGTRFSDRITGKPQDFLPDSTIIHVDIDPAELCKNIEADVPVVCDAKKFLTKVIDKLQEQRINFELREWLEIISQWQNKYPLSYEPGPELKPQQVIQEVARKAGDEAIVVTDVGQHQMFAAQYYTMKSARKFLSSGGLGTMGFGLPAALGAALGNPEKDVILFTGDGSFQMNIQELATLAQNKLPVKVFILNNECLGMVRQWQEMFFEERYSQTLLSGNPDFVRLAEVYEIKGLRITKPEELQTKVEEALQHRGPVIVECAIDPRENVFPIIPPGGKPNEMLGRWQGETHISRIS